jgi:hypothetical protein
MPAWRRAIPIATAIAVIVGAIAADVVLSACGSLTSPSIEMLAVTISATGVNPAHLIGNGPRTEVKFFNQDTERHDIRFNSDPDHPNCSTLSSIFLGPGDGVTIGTFNSGFMCGYHDETRPDDVRFQGTISIR